MKKIILFTFLILLTGTSFLEASSKHTRNRPSTSSSSNKVESEAGLNIPKWGKRSLENSSNKMITTGLDKIKNLSGKVIIVMNHKSMLDFVLCFFALSHAKTKRGRFLRPRFIAAKDHMMDNPFIYHILGVGKLIDSVGMVFIERKKAGVGIQSLSEAAHNLTINEIDIAIFPQGTRAEGNLDRSGKRRDAGYYTTFSRKLLHLEEGHLRKGTSFLAIDTLLELKKLQLTDPVHLVFVGIEGTATTMSKQSFFAQTETEIHFNIGEVLTLHQNEVKDFKKPENLQGNFTENEKNYLNFVDKLHQKIDQGLTNSIPIKESLIHRLNLELNGNLRYPKDRINTINKKIDELDSSTNVIYRILDRIFASNPNTWNGNLTRVAQALLEVNPKPRLDQLNEEISLTMLANLKRKAHGKKVK
jgi:1-acyl-sn-glycerol-3-phosphate acyltransferase